VCSGPKCRTPNATLAFAETKIQRCGEFLQFGHSTVSIPADFKLLTSCGRFQKSSYGTELPDARAAKSTTKRDKASANASCRFPQCGLFANLKLADGSSVHRPCVRSPNATWTGMARTKRSDAVQQDYLSPANHHRRRSVDFVAARLGFQGHEYLVGTPKKNAGAAKPRRFFVFLQVDRSRGREVPETRPLNFWARARPALLQKASLKVKVVFSASVKSL